MNQADYGAPISRESLYEQVADRIMNLILSEALGPGDKLPGERELAQQLGVSRVVIREAVKVLYVQGLLEIKQGSGTYVRELDSANISKSLELYLKLDRSANAFKKLLEVRNTLEIEIAGLAALRATDADIENIEAAIRAMEVSIGSPEEFANADFEFHKTLADATHNDLYGILLEPIAGLSLDFRLLAYRFDPEETIQGGLTHHQLILEQVKARDPNEARRAMRDHLRQAQELFDLALGQQSNTE